ncbi:MAG TPA: rhodanese-like domain-containing protein [Thermoanaerobaculia bacterium]|jgi:rhodanese-related sulfurtransferase|nr:rhodanese-like domain-containing protein [Thermoanaerobaculia bacterium]
MSIREITPTELQQLLAGDNPPALIDVREEGEAAICAIDGSTLIPMNSLPQRLQEIPRDRPVALYCHAGMRSMMAGQWLSQQGFDALSLAGGIDRWAVEIEPSMNRY